MFVICKVIFRNSSTSTIAGKTGNKNVHQREEYKLVQNFSKICHSRAHFFLFLYTVLFIIENIPARRDIFQFIEILR